MKATTHKPLTLLILAIFITLRQDVMAVDFGQTLQVKTDAQSTQQDNIDSLVRSQWGLDESEWQRYLTLKQGIRGSFSQPNISPLEVLGIHADTEKERRDYAARFARLTIEDTDRVLAFARLYQEEAAKLTKNSPVVDIGRLNTTPNPATSGIDLKNQDRLLFFTRTGDCTDCNAQLKRLISVSQGKKIKLDIYLVGVKDDQGIREWAEKQVVPIDRNKGGSATLNHDHGTLGKLMGPATTVPTTILMRGNNYVSVNPNQIN